jgi:hypothetical protein
MGGNHLRGHVDLVHLRLKAMNLPPELGDIMADVGDQLTVLGV